MTSYLTDEQTHSSARCTVEDKRLTIFVLPGIVDLVKHFHSYFVVWVIHLFHPELDGLNTVVCLLCSVAAVFLTVTGAKPAQ